MSDSIFSQRRKMLMSQLKPNSIALLTAAPRVHKSHDVYFPYRQDSNFYYLTGYEYPDAIAILAPKRIEGDFILFIREENSAQAQWIGPGMTCDKAKEIYGASDVFRMDQFIEMLPELLDSHEHVYYPHDYHVTDLPTRILNTITRLKKRAKAKAHPPSNLVDLTKLINEMRLIKSEKEIELLRKVADITAKAHIRAMKRSRPNLHEYELRAEIIYEFYKHNAEDEAYPTIVASGENACILHYTKNDARLEDHRLVLIDAGAEYRHYTSDLSRTFPVNGHFNDYQRKLYDIVLTTQQAVIDLIKPGVNLHDLQELTIYHLTQGLVALNILKGSVHDAIKAQSYKRFFMHNVSHWLGMNVHDDSAYKVNEHWRDLKPGMVLTVEPGLYIPNARDIDIHWRGTGIRIEDVILVTKNGAEVLTHKAPKSIDEIEKIMTQSRR